jgi:hypothetical protein
MYSNQQSANPWGNAQLQQAFPVGNANFTSGDFPSLGGGQQAQKQQTECACSNPFGGLCLKCSCGPTTVFVPQGVNMFTDDDDGFVDLDAGKKKKQPQKPQKTL